MVWSIDVAGWKTNVWSYGWQAPCCATHPKDVAIFAKWCSVQPVFDVAVLIGDHDDDPADESS
jgi:hypothetical protein